jgi:hypothetical protein
MAGGVGGFRLKAAMSVLSRLRPAVGGMAAGWRKC